jgi:adenylate cyclase class 2
MSVETEIKLRVTGTPQDAGALLQRLDYHATGPRQLEDDVVFDRQGELRTSGRLLRLRWSAGTWTLTYKGPSGPGRHKSREEIEVGLTDGATFSQILGALGYTVAFRYEKRRTKFRNASQPGLITLDETPIGDFLELEGPGDWIDRTAESLGYTVADYLTASYATLYEEHCRMHGGVPSAMRF